ncbi:hypothetical protein [Micromonospora fulviviridis]|uniref:Uncharacterized protein n=1 Tax=Micromonospora fulviviridis TaxID=47860 RepID=A0ABV2VQW2_9ACTN
MVFAFGAFLLVAGAGVFSLLDVLPASFEDLPETLDAATKTKIAHRLEHEGLLTQAQWADLNP